MNNIGIDSEIKTLVVVFDVDNNDDRQCPVPLITIYSELVNMLTLAFKSNFCGLMCYLCIFATFAACVIISDIYFTFLL